MNAMTKTAWITGATSGFGRATAKRFVEGSWKIVASGRRADRLEALRAELGSDRAHTCAFDIRD
jgi:serine 3-dehydrogenase